MVIISSDLMTIPFDYKLKYSDQTQSFEIIWYESEFEIYLTHTCAKRSENFGH